MKELRNKLLAVFDGEHREHLAVIREFLNDAESAPDSLSGAELQECFRRIHSLKGAARAVNIPGIESLAHRLESVLSGLQSGERSLDSELVGTLRRSLDAVEDLAAAAMGKRSAPSIAALEEELGDTASTAGRQILSSQAAASVDEARTRPNRDLQKSARASDEPMQVSTANVDRMMQAIASVQVGERQRQSLQDSVSSLMHGLLALKTELPHLDSGSGQSARRMRRALTELVDLSRHLQRELRTSSWKAAQAGRKLRSEVASIRLDVASSVLGDLGSHARELASDEGKQVRVECKGLDVKADRLVLQQLKRPLLQLLRNAISHGIELPEERRNAGKPPEGSVVLRASTDARFLKVEVRDDGRGVDVDKVRSIAINNGNPDDDDLLQLLALPGLSTSDSVNRLSGRGIGMGIVTDAVHRLQGEVSIRTSCGKGTTIRVRVPLSVASTRVLLVRIADETYAVPSHAVRRVLHVHRDEVGPLSKGLGLAVDGSKAPVPLASLGEMLGLGTGAALQSAQTVCALAVGQTDIRRVLVVDEIVAVRDEVLVPTDDVLAGDARLAGAVLLDNDTVAPVVNPAWLLSGDAPLSFSCWQKNAPVPARKPVILVADDSVTTRTLEKSILESHGYAVILAVDGNQALAKLRENLVDIVVADVDMPELDGFGLLRAIKSDPERAELPVIMVTSKNSEQDIRTGQDLGADAYLIKQSFEQAELLETVRRLL